MHRGASPGGNLVVVERHKDVLGIAAVDAVAVAVEHEHIDEVCVAVDLVAGFCIHAAAAADDLAVALERDVEPDLVGVDGSLGEEMAEGQRADHGFQQVVASLLKHRHCRPQRGSQRGIDRRAFADAKQIHPHAALKKLAVGFHDLRPVIEPGEPGVG